jgi:hypothetical protein
MRAIVAVEQFDSHDPALCYIQNFTSSFNARETVPRTDTSTDIEAMLLIVSISKIIWQNICLFIFLNSELSLAANLCELQTIILMMAVE